jgi:hypothetical protein
MVSSLDKAVADLDEVASEAAVALGGDDGGYDNGGGGTVRTKRTGGPARSVAARSVRSSRTTGSRSSRGSRGSGVSGGSGGGDPAAQLKPETLAKLRDAQRMVALLVAADDLPPALKDELRGIRGDLELQRVVRLCLGGWGGWGAS